MATLKPHDAVFKSTFEQRAHAAALFLYMLSHELAEALAWPTLELEPAAFVDTDLTDRHGDLLFTVETREGALLYLLLEHQSSHDASMPLRMHVYQGQIWQRFRKDRSPTAEGPMPLIIPLLVSHAPGGWSSPPNLGAMLAVEPSNVALAPFIPNLTIVVEDLACRSNEELDAGLSTTIPKLTLWLLRDARHASRFLENLRYWAPTFAAALHEPGGEHSVEPLLNYIALVGDPPMWDIFATTVRELAPEAGRIIMTIAEKWIEQGLEQGREQGLEQGRADILRQQLARKFGELPPEVKSRIANASRAEIEVWADRVLFCASLDEIFADSH